MRPSLAISALGLALYFCHKSLNLRLALDVTTVVTVRATAGSEMML